MSLGMVRLKSHDFLGGGPGLVVAPKFLQNAGAIAARVHIVLPERKRPLVTREGFIESLHVDEGRCRDC
jgi:hypothetical protein